MPFIPVLSVVLLAALERHQAAGLENWFQFASIFLMAMLWAAPLFASHYWLSKSIGPASLMFWILAFVAYPLAATFFLEIHSPLAARHWLTAAIFSALMVLPGFGRQSELISFMRRLPITLDAAVIALLAVWTIAATMLFGSTPDAVNNQPLKIWFDAQRLLSHPLVFLSYGLQFSAIALLLYGLYWTSRYVLVRQILRTEGWIAMALASFVFCLVYSPLACTLILQLPVNPSHWSVLPSENHNPFDAINYGFTAILWATIMPVILASERLLAERSEALERQERVRSELHVLQQQINPHFLFNSLNTLYALCLKDSPASAQLTLKLSELLQYTVYQGGNDFVRLDEEVAYLRNYIDMQLLRFGSRCRVAFNIPEDVGHFRIPPLLLIMLVENAFKHGVEPQDVTSEIAITLSIDNGRLHFSCVNAPLPPKPRAQSSGLGLQNMRRRLDLTMEGRFKLSSVLRGNAWHAELQLDTEPC